MATYRVDTTTLIERRQTWEIEIPEHYGFTPGKGYEETWPELLNRAIDTGDSSLISVDDVPAKPGEAHRPGRTIVTWDRLR